MGPPTFSRVLAQVCRRSRLIARRQGDLQEAALCTAQYKDGGDWRQRCQAFLSSQVVSQNT
jgi:hypothetical protein